MIRVFDKYRKAAGRSNAFIGQLRPTLMAITGAGEVVARPGWLYANGAAVSRATYAALFAKIGTTNGAGDGSTTFNLPDYRGRLLSCDLDGQAAGGNRMAAAAGTAAGEATHALSLAETPRHGHDKGTLAITAGGSHAHSHTLTLGGNNNTTVNPQDRPRSAWQSGSGSTFTSGWFSGSTATSTHAHPSGEFSGATGDGSADTLAGTAHSNIPPVLGCAVMVAF